MKKPQLFTGYLLFGLGLYYLLVQYDVEWFTSFHAWPTLLIIVGIALLMHSYQQKDYENLAVAVIVLGLGIHFHGLATYDFWVDHWGVYVLIVGMAVFLRALRTKRGLLQGIILMVLSLVFIFWNQVPELKASMPWLEAVSRYWPFLLLGCGIYFIRKK